MRAREMRRLILFSVLNVPILNLGAKNISSREQEECVGSEATKRMGKTLALPVALNRISP